MRHVAVSGAAVTPPLDPPKIASNLPASDPFSAISAMWLAQGRDGIEALCEAAIAFLDQVDGDADIEPNGDELDGDPHAEDDFADHSAFASGPGCSLSDPGEEDDPAGQRDEDGVNVVKLDELDDAGPGCPISDPGGCDGGLDQSPREQLQRIHMDRCTPRITKYRTWTGDIESRISGYRLLHPPMVPSRRQLITRRRGVPAQPRG